MSEGVLLGPLALFAAAMCLTPGPNVVMVTASAVNFGFRRAIPHILGITIGFAFLILAAGFGLAGLLKAEPRLHLVLKYAGATYLLYLSWRIAQSDASGDHASRTKPISFTEAMLFQWINPKGWVIAIGALAAYTTAEGDGMWKTMVITCVLAAACLLSAVLWAGFGAGVRRLLASPRIRIVFNWSMSGLLVVSLIPVFL